MTKCKHVNLLYIALLLLVSSISNAEMVINENEPSSPVYMTFAGPVSGKTSGGELGYKWRFSAMVNDKKVREVEFYLRRVGGGSQKIYQIQSPFQGPDNIISWETDVESIDSKTADWLRSDGTTEFVILAIYTYKRDHGGGVVAPISFTNEMKKLFIGNSLDANKFNALIKE